MEISLFDEQESRCLVSRVIDLPPLPTALQRLVEIIQSEMGSLNDLERVIRYDQACRQSSSHCKLDLLRLPRGQIRTIARALVLIGFEQAKRVCLCALLMELFSSGKALILDREILWKEAFATAKFAGEIASRRRGTPRKLMSLACFMILVGWSWPCIFPTLSSRPRIARHRKIPVVRGNGIRIGSQHDRENGSP